MSKDNIGTPLHAFNLEKRQECLPYMMRMLMAIWNMCLA